MFALAALWLLAASGVHAQPEVFNSFRPASAHLTQEFALVQSLVANLSLRQNSNSLSLNDDDYHQLTSSINLDPCADSKCKATFTNLKLPYSMPCSTASGAVPEKPQLPLVFPGNYDLCRISFADEGHFCTIQTGPVLLPLFNSKGKLADVAPMGKLFLGKCVPNACTAQRLKQRFVGGVRRLALRLGQNLDVRQVLALEQMLERSVVVRCESDGKRENGDETEVMGTTIFYFLLLMTVLFAALGTVYHTCFYPHTAAKPHVLFSVKRNLTMLLSPMRGMTDLAFLNGVRIASILWVIYGHTSLLSSGIGLAVPVSNPSATNEELFGPVMVMIRGGEYAVDTFFFMSGLLAMAHLLASGGGNKQKEWRLNVKSYLHFILARYVRLVPVYLFVMHFYVKAMPYWGSGPYWHANTGRKQMEHQCQDFWANLLFINNLVPWGGKRGGIGGCMGWTWYLAADFQFVLLVPWLYELCLWTLKRHHSTLRPVRQLALVAPCLVLVAMQIAVTTYLAWHYNIQGAFNQDYSVKIYVKPWCRIAPYALGCLYAILRHERASYDEAAIVVEEEEHHHHARRPSSSGWWWCPSRPKLQLLLGAAVCCTVVGVLADDMACRPATGKSDCASFYAGWMYGALGHGNWPRAGVAAFVGTSYAAWGLGLLLMCEYATSPEGQRNFVVRALGHASLAPLARLTYVVYMIHMIVMIMFYAQRTGPLVNSPGRQLLDAIGFATATFAIALVLHLLVERPINSVLAWVLKMDAQPAAQPQQHARRPSQDDNAATGSPRERLLVAA